MSHRTRPFLIAALTAALLPATALADSTGNIGTVSKFTVYESSSDNYGMSKGSLFVKERKEKGKQEEREYKWGGSLCPGRELSPETIGLLFEVLRDRKTKITPTYKTGVANTRCLTGFTFERD